MIIWLNLNWTYDIVIKYHKRNELILRIIFIITTTTLFYNNFFHITKTKTKIKIFFSYLYRNFIVCWWCCWSTSRGKTAKLKIIFKVSLSLNECPNWSPSSSLWFSTSQNIKLFFDHELIFFLSKIFTFLSIKQQYLSLTQNTYNFTWNLILYMSFQSKVSLIILS